MRDTSQIFDSTEAIFINETASFKRPAPAPAPSPRNV